MTRASFLTPDFDPNVFLSSLHNRHQTLEDLRSELRQRSQDLNKELLDLVNSNYEEFLGLGRDLRGGDEKVEEVRLGVLGFRREIEGLKGKVSERKAEVEQLLQERKCAREQIVLGEKMLEVDRRIGDLEGRLMLVQNETTAEGAEELESEDSEEEVEGGVELGKLRRHAEQYVYITRLVKSLGPELPFLVNREGRILKLKQTVLLDLNSGLKQASAAGEGGKLHTLKLLELFRLMDESKEALSVIQNLKDERK